MSLIHHHNYIKLYNKLILYISEEALLDKFLAFFDIFLQFSAALFSKINIELDISFYCP